MKNSIETILSQVSGQLRLLERVATENGVLTIEENAEYRWIRDNYNAYYSILDKSQSDRLVLPYLNTMMTALLFLPEPKSILLLGAGGGALMRFWNKYLPNSYFQAIDYDDRMIEITEKYFLNNLTFQNSIINIEAMEYISKETKNNYDLVFVDLFSHGALPDIYNNITFYEYCKNRANKGIVVFNLLIDGESEFTNIMNLVISVFNKRYLCLSVPGYKNIIVLAFNDNICIKKNIIELRKRCEQLHALYKIEFDDLLDEIILTNTCNENVLQI